MAVLNDFLGAVVSSISNARVQADIQTLEIAREYAKNDLLRNFSIPRMRLKDIEIKVPVAMESLRQSEPARYGFSDSKAFASTVYTSVLKIMEADKFPAEISKAVRASISEGIKVVETGIKAGNREKVIKEFSNSISAEIMKHMENIFKSAGRKFPEKNELQFIHDRLPATLEELLHKELKQKPGTGDFSALNVIVEADKLREIKPEFMVMITMKVSEDGMEWHTSENSNGERISTLLPE